MLKAVLYYKAVKKKKKKTIESYSLNPLGQEWRISFCYS